MQALVAMRALKSWRNRAYEGDVAADADFSTPAERARDLERRGLAVPLPPAPVAMEAAELHPLSPPAPGAGKPPSSSPPAPAPRKRRSKKLKAAPG